MKIKKLFIDTINQLLVDLNNHYLDHRDKQWISKRHHVKCMICGDEIYSQYLYGKKVSKWSPEQCGWIHTKCTDGLFKSKGWICHSCNGHFHDHWVDRYKLMDCLDYKQNGETKFILGMYDVELLNKENSNDRIITIDGKHLMDVINIGLNDGYEIKLKE